MYSPGRKVKIIICTTALLLCRCAELFGAPHNGDLYKVKQPDGAYVEVRVWGDEFYQRAESLDGYTLVRDPETRWICYAELNDDASELLSTGIIYEGTAIDETGGLKAD
ncbi:MAG: M6 family metalloprotease domain-containing protein, partial [Planctomycetota bacterium]